MKSLAEDHADIGPTLFRSCRAKREVEVIQVVVGIPKDDAEALSRTEWWGTESKRSKLALHEARSLYNDITSAGREDKAGLVEHFNEVGTAPANPVILTFDFLKEEYHPIYAISRSLKCEVSTLVRAVFHYLARKQRIEEEETAEMARQDAHIEALPLLWRLAVRRAPGRVPICWGGKAAEMILKLRTGTYFPNLRPSRRGHAPLEVKPLRSQRRLVRVSLPVLSYVLERLKKDGFAMGDVVASMTTFAGLANVRADVEEVWFGTPAARCGMLQMLGGWDGRKHERAEFVIPIELWKSIEKAAGIVKTSPENWIRGCLAVSGRDPRAPEGEVYWQRQDAERELEGLREAVVQ